MQLESKDLGLIVVGALFVFIVAYIGYDRTDKTGQARYASSQGSALTTGFSVIDMAISQLDTGEHYFHPAHCVPGQTQIFTAHKYPNASGGNISTLIHQGMDALRQPAPQDNDWITRPPAEVMFL